MNKILDIGSITLLLLAGASAPVLKASDLVLQKTGYAREVGAMRETLEFSGQKVTQYRDVFNIPEGFGRLITITPGGEGVVFWFQNEQGEIRNVSIPATSHLIVQRKGKVIIEPGIGG